MRCVECLPLIEELFDGETDERAAAQIRAHLSACADCAAALDALSFEQEIYARYDRGLEVGPSLWPAVSAEIARGPQTEQSAPRQNFLNRAREAVAASFAALALRPALASSLALLFVGVVVGSLWLARRPTTEVKTAVAVNSNEGTTAAPPSPAGPTAPVETGGGKNEDSTGATVGGLGMSPENEVRRSITRTPPNPVGGARGSDDPEKAIDYKPQSDALTRGTVGFSAAPEHAAEDSALNVVAAKFDSGDAAARARLLDPAQKELARHVERAEMLLRSIKNARPSDGDKVNVSYEKNLSRKLLAENSTLKLDADARGDRESKQVLDSIEPFLLDIANLRDDASREEVRSVKDRVKKTEIIAALQVY